MCKCAECPCIWAACQVTIIYTTLNLTFTRRRRQGERSWATGASALCPVTGYSDIYPGCSTAPAAGCRQTLNRERLDKIWIRMFFRYFPNCSSVPLTTKSAAFILSNVISGEVVGSVLWTWDHLKTWRCYLVWSYVETIRMFGAWRQAVRAKSIYVHGIWEDGLHVHVINNGGGALADIQMVKCV